MLLGIIELHSKGSHLDCQGDLLSRLIMGMSRVTLWAIEVIDLLTKSA